MGSFGKMNLGSWGLASRSFQQPGRRRAGSQNWPKMKQVCMGDMTGTRGRQAKGKWYQQMLNFSATQLRTKEGGMFEACARLRNARRESHCLFRVAGSCRSVSAHTSAKVPLVRWSVTLRTKLDDKPILLPTAITLLGTVICPLRHMASQQIVDGIF